MFEKGFLSSLDLVDSIRMAGQKVSRFLLSPPPPDLGLQVCCRTHAVSVGAREQTNLHTSAYSKHFIE